MFSHYDIKVAEGLFRNTQPCSCYTYNDKLFQSEIFSQVIQNWVLNLNLDLKITSSLQYDESLSMNAFRNHEIKVFFDK